MTTLALGGARPGWVGGLRLSMTMRLGAVRAGLPSSAGPSRSNTSTGIGIGFGSDEVGFGATLVEGAAAALVGGGGAFGFSKLIVLGGPRRCLTLLAGFESAFSGLASPGAAPGKVLAAILTFLAGLSPDAGWVSVALVALVTTGRVLIVSCSVVS